MELLSLNSDVLVCIGTFLDEVDVTVLKHTWKEYKVLTREKKGVTKGDLCKKAGWEGYLEVLIWLLNPVYNTGLSIVTESKDSFTARENDCPWNSSACYIAAEKGYLQDVELNKVLDFESALHSFMSSERKELMDAINQSGNYNDDIESQLKDAFDNFKATQSW
jgi:hypothetical protein